jgi:hypothetical protein
LVEQRSERELHCCIRHILADTIYRPSAERAECAPGCANAIARAAHLFSNYPALRAEIPLRGVAHLVVVDGVCRDAHSYTLGDMAAADVDAAGKDLAWHHAW